MVLASLLRGVVRAISLRWDLWLRVIGSDFAPIGLARRVIGSDFAPIQAWVKGCWERFHSDRGCAEGCEERFRSAAGSSRGQSGPISVFSGLRGGWGGPISVFAVPAPRAERTDFGLCRPAASLSGPILVFAGVGRGPAPRLPGAAFGDQRSFGRLADTGASSKSASRGGRGPVRERSWAARASAHERCAAC